MSEANGAFVPWQQGVLAPTLHQVGSDWVHQYHPTTYILPCSELLPACAGNRHVGITPTKWRQQLGCVDRWVLPTGKAVLPAVCAPC